MICKNCKKEIPDNSKFCNYCGTEQVTINNEESIENSETFSEQIEYTSTVEDIVEEFIETSETINNEQINLYAEKSANIKNQNSNKTKKKKPNRFIKILKVGFGIILSFFILILIVGVITTKNLANLSLDNITKEVKGKTLVLTGSTDVGNILVCNGKDYSSSINNDGKFKIEVPLNNIGENEISIYAMKKDNEKSKFEKTFIVNRINNDFTLDITPNFNSKIEQDKAIVIGNIKEPGASVKVTGPEVNYDLISDENGKFEFAVTLIEEGKYDYKIVCQKEGFNTYITTYSIERVLPTIKLTLDKINSPVYSKRITISGKTEPKANIIVSGDINLEKIANSQGEFSFDVNTAIEGQYNILIKARKDGFKENIKEVSFKRELTEEEKFIAYANACQSVSYKVLKKNPDKYIGTKVKFTGQVLEIQESGNYTIMRIAVTNLGYGMWDFNDALLVEFNNSTEIVEDDIVNVYGVITGTYTYTSIAGWNITIPSMEAEFVQY